ncbi:hypothetical protein PC116_g32532, partial [Phytophthora cactorum]
MKSYSEEKDKLEFSKARLEPSKYETSVIEAAQEFKDEPDWIVDQMLKRKREEILKQWEEREARLRKIRAQEKAIEERGSKRRRLEEGNARNSKKTDNSDDDDDEWLLDEGQDKDSSQDGDDTSGFSKETRVLMNKLGLGSLKTTEENEDISDSDIK